MMEPREIIARALAEQDYGGWPGEVTSGPGVREDQAYYLDAAALGQVVDEAEIADIAIEFEQGAVAEAGVENGCGIFMAAGEVDLLLGQPAYDARPSGERNQQRRHRRQHSA